MHMHEASEFSRKAEERIAAAAERRRLEVEAAEIELQAAIDKGVAHKEATRLKALRDSRHEGTPPELVWGEGAGQLTRDFLDFMGKSAFAGAIILKERVKHLTGPTYSLMTWRYGEHITEWATQGYGIACVGIDGVTSGPSGHSRTPTSYRVTIPKIPVISPNNVFLCVDGQLRYQVDHRITDLPIDDSGEREVPKPGKFVIRYKDALVSDRYGESSSRCQAPYYDFQPMDLEEMLLNAASSSG